LIVKFKELDGRPAVELFWRDSALTNPIQHNETADCETSDSPERSHLGEVWAEVEPVCKEGADGAQDTYHVEPARSSDGTGETGTQTKLEEHSNESDGSQNDDGHWTMEGSPACVEHHQRNRQDQETGGDDRPATGWERRSFGQ
jgi:hypothetical protein